MVRCPSCNFSYVADLAGSLPPWCSKCGADLKAKPSALAQAVSQALPIHAENSFHASPPAASKWSSPRFEQQSPAPTPMPRNASSPFVSSTYFEVRGGRKNYGKRLFRVYVREAELLFIDFGTDEPSMGQRLAVGHAGLLGGVIASALQERQRKQNFDNKWHLDCIDDAELDAMVDSGKKHFRLTGDDVQEIFVEALTGWQRFWTGSRSTGTIRFKRADGAQFKFDVLKQEGMKAALDLFPGLFDDRLSINAVFDRQNFRFVPKPKAEREIGWSKTGEDERFSIDPDGCVGHAHVAGGVFRPD